MLKLLASKAGMESAMKLRDALEEELGLEPKTILVSSNSHNCAGDNVLLRYGCSYGKLEVEPKWGSPRFTPITVDKAVFAEKFGGIIHVPEFVADRLPTAFPVLVRETLTGCASEGLHLTHNQREFLEVWSPGFFWTPFLAHEFELRVNAVFTQDGVATRIYKKVPRVDGVVNEDSQVSGLNGEDNMEWVLVNSTSYPKVLAILEKMKAKVLELGGTFMGIDMIYVPVLKDYVVLEINSAPWLTKKAATWLAKQFLKGNRVTV